MNVTERKSFALAVLGPCELACKDSKSKGSFYLFYSIFLITGRQGLGFDA